MTLATVVQVADAMAGVQRKAGLPRWSGGRLPARQSVAGGAGHGLLLGRPRSAGRSARGADSGRGDTSRSRGWGPAARRLVAGQAADILRCGPSSGQSVSRR